MFFELSSYNLQIHEYILITYRLWDPLGKQQQHCTYERGIQYG